MADTHLRPGSLRRLSDTVVAELERADVVLHAGDILTGDVLELLAGYAPVHAVLGNNDHELAGLLPERLELDLDGVAVGMVHDSGARRGREARLHRSFPRSALVVFGHSHIPWNAPGLDGQWLLNPGSPTDKRSQPHASFATVELADGQIKATEIVQL
ncbi:MAG: metallophosphoesterase family protein [Acidimicrobiia bacterium]|nr:metallophosphoesterase family protein [Acidimicrobiia bacterium]MBA3955855.1 metallophosphoesterase family protein [Acidimicrobiia bacterium]